MKKLLCSIFMILSSLCLIIISIILPIVFSINSNSIMDSINHTSYIENSEEEVKLLFSNYMDNDKVSKLMKKISISDDIKYIINYINYSDNTDIYSIMYNRTNKTILSVIDDNNESNEKYSNTLTSLYLNELFPIKEYTSLCKIYNLYFYRILLVLIVSILLASLFSIYLLNDIKTSKWTFIALYNAIIIDILLVGSYNILEKLTISNTTLLNVILDLLKNMKYLLIFIIILLITISIVLNYFKYIKNKKKKKY